MVSISGGFKYNSANIGRDTELPAEVNELTQVYSVNLRTMSAYSVKSEKLTLLEILFLSSPMLWFNLI